MGQRGEFASLPFFSSLLSFSTPFTAFSHPHNRNRERAQNPFPRGSKICLLMQTLAFGSLRLPKEKTIPLTFPLSSFLKLETVTIHDLYWRGQKT
jgi:hypothetical protein